ncbi:zinc-dependent alcohol dehydrogenase family protein [Actimicrobium sp. GrIS 1.19]|uniref:zinc-dependent alcohol dehydrogenase family protein n=1 Tax=Actimicrobium sp. GrIS 1.19 TaxID=3071708 RepID=UPI002E138D83
MAAMVLDQAGLPLRPMQLPVPQPLAHEVQIKVSACGVCRTDLHIADGELPVHKRPLVMGHEVVGRISAIGAGVRQFAVGDRVGVPWLGGTCGACRYCGSGLENLCDAARFTGYDRDGGYAQYVVADARFTFALPPRHDDLQAAPLMCAGLIGYRAYAMAGDAQHLGVYGFGAAAHIITQVARHQGRRVYAFTRPGDVRSQQFALSLGAHWAGGTDVPAPALLDAALIFAPAGELVPLALAAVRKGGTVVCAGIHMSEIPAFAYALLWGERTVRSVANLTRADVLAFLAIAERIDLQVSARAFPLAQANAALDALRAGKIDGAAVLVMG